MVGLISPKNTDSRKMQDFPSRASWVPPAREGLESYLGKEVLKVWKNNAKKVKGVLWNAHEKRRRKEDSYTCGLLRLCGARASHLAHCSEGTIYCLVHGNTRNKSCYHFWYDYFDYSVYHGWEWTIKIKSKCRFYLHRYWKVSLFSKAFCYCSLHPGESSDAWSFPLAP